MNKNPDENIMTPKDKKSWLTTLIIFVLYLLITVFITFLRLFKKFNEFKPGAAIIIAAILIVLLILIRRQTGSSWGDELQKTIQLEIFSYSYIAFQLLLSFIIIFFVVFHFQIDTGTLLVLIMAIMGFIQSAAAYFVKRKYK